MKITLESTTRTVTVNGVPARIWEGTTETGTKVYACITRIAIAKDEPGEVVAQFDHDLSKCRQPTDAAIEAFPVKMVL